MEDLLKAIADLGFPIAVDASINQLSIILSIKLGNNDNDKSALQKHSCWDLAWQECFYFFSYINF